MNFYKKPVHTHKSTTIAIALMVALGYTAGDITQAAAYTNNSSSTTNTRTTEDSNTNEKNENKTDNTNNSGADDIDADDTDNTNTDDVEEGFECLAYDKNTSTELNAIPLGVKANNSNGHKLSSSLEVANLENRQFSHSMLEPVARFVRAGEKITVEVKDGIKQQELYLGVGLYGYQGKMYDNYNTAYPSNYMGQGNKFELKQGTNEIVSKTDGLVYLINDSSGDNTYTAKVTGGTKVPVYISGKTSDEEWAQQLKDMSDAPFVEIIGERMFGSFQMRQIKEHLKGSPQSMVDKWDAIIDRMDEVYGLDVNAVGLHQKRDHRVHIANPDRFSLSFGYAYANHDYIGFHANGSGARMFNPEYTYDIDTLIHEVGHTYQTTQYLWRGMMETTVEIASTYISENIKHNHTRQNQTHVDRMRQHLNNSNSYDSLGDAHEGGKTKVLMFEQLRYAFGDNFFPNLHQEYRIAVASGKIAKDLNDTEKVQTLIKMTSMVANRDLSPFYKKWGLTISSDTSQTISKYPALQKNIWDNLLSGSKTVEVEVSARGIASNEGTFPAVSNAEDPRKVKDRGIKVSGCSDDGNSGRDQSGDDRPENPDDLDKIDSLDPEDIQDPWDIEDRDLDKDPDGSDSANNGNNSGSNSGSGAGNGSGVGDNSGSRAGKDSGAAAGVDAGSGNSADDSLMSDSNADSTGLGGDSTSDLDGSSGPDTAGSDTAGSGKELGSGYDVAGSASDNSALDSEKLANTGANIALGCSVGVFLLVSGLVLLRKRRSRV